MYGFLSANKSTPDCPSMSNSNAMKQFAYGLLSLNKNVQIMLQNSMTWEKLGINSYMLNSHAMGENFISKLIYSITL